MSESAKKSKLLPLLILSGTLLLQLGFLAYMNFFAYDKILNFDGANAMLHAAEMWKTKSVRVPGWVDTTQLELDMAAALVLPLYGLTGNLFFSYGLANVAFAALYVWVISDIFRQRGYAPFYALIGLNLVFTPYCIGMIDYYSMLFYQAAFYDMRVMIVLLLLDLMVAREEERKSAAHRFFLFLLCLFAFLSGLSCGIYILLSGILPIAALFAFEAVASGDFFRKKTPRREGENEAEEGINGEDKRALYRAGVLSLSFVFCAAGYLLCRALGFNGLGDRMQLVSYQNMTGNFHAVLLSFFMVLDALPQEAGVIVTSPTGVLYLCKALVALLLLFVFFLHIRTLFSRQTKPAGEDNGGKEGIPHTNGFPFGKYVAFLLLWNVLEFVFCETRYSYANPIIENRYYLLPLLPLFLLLAMQVREWESFGTKAFGVCVDMFAAVFLFVLAFGCMRAVVKKFDADGGYIKDVVAYVGEALPDVDTVVLLHEPDTQGIYRLLDSERKYTAYDTEEQSLVVYDYYRSYTEDLGEKNAILLYEWETPEELLPEEIASAYDKAGEVRWFHIYVADEDRFHE